MIKNEAEEAKRERHYFAKELLIKLDVDTFNSYKMEVDHNYARKNNIDFVLDKIA